MKAVTGLKAIYTAKVSEIRVSLTVKDEEEEDMNVPNTLYSFHARRDGVNKDQACEAGPVGE